MTEAASPWVLARASVRGKSHIDGEIVNQDAVHVASRAGEPCFAVAISDGAGSAKRAEEGSRHFSRLVADGLQKLAMQVHAGKIAGGSQNLIADEIYRLIADARALLNVGSDSLRDFHCNLMALVLGPKWGLMVHLGDAVMLKSRFERRADKVDFFVDTGMTAQDRTEYANETHFVTEPDWTKHLVWSFIDPNGSDDFFSLMTDGAADIALGNVPGSVQKRVNRGFFAPLVSMVMAASDEAERNMIVDSALADRQTYRITGDDKTMVLVIRRSQLPLSHYELVQEEQVTPKAEDGKDAELTDQAKMVSATAQAPTPVIVPAAPVPLVRDKQTSKHGAATAHLNAQPKTSSLLVSSPVGSTQLPSGRHASGAIRRRDKFKYASLGAALMLSVILLAGVAWSVKNRVAVKGGVDVVAAPATAASEPSKKQRAEHASAPASKAPEPAASGAAMKEDAKTPTNIVTATISELVPTPTLVVTDKAPEPKKSEKPAAKPAHKAASAGAAAP
jgi:hypothetical protein